MIVVCQTGTEDPLAQALFLIEETEENVQITGMGDMVGMRMVPMGEVSFNNTRVSEANRVGEESRGHAYLKAFMNEMRIETGAMGVGIAQGALDRALEYSRKREQFGRTIGSFDVIRNKLADMAMNTELARWAVYRAAWLLDAGKPDLQATLTAKHIGAKTAYVVAHDAVQIHGGLGYMRESSIEHYFRDAKVLDLFMEPGQIQKNLVADQLLGERRK
jgi:alkylation response protein AidB-like acyl-CoA dehydrogenase